jgi:hypothetical protein
MATIIPESKVNPPLDSLSGERIADFTIAVNKDQSLPKAMHLATLRLRLPRRDKKEFASSEQSVIERRPTTCIILRVWPTNIVAGPKTHHSQEMPGPTNWFILGYS